MDLNESDWEKRWPAPAKINLMLRITGRRADGYHLLQTVFQLTDLCDWIRFHRVEGAEFSLLNPMPGVPAETDLTVRAAQLLREETGCQQGVCIEVEKNLPMGGGLGGGSSDAATTLLVLNHLWQLNLSKDKLMQLGLKLGADVPVFIFGFAAWAEGVGEQLQKIDIPEKWLVIVKPECHVDTKQIFSEKRLTRDSKSIKIPDFIAGQYQNDCTDVVCDLYDSIRDAMVDLSVFSEARLTGTGACIFAQFESKDLAEKAYRSLSGRWQVYLTQGLNESLLSDYLV